MPHIPNIMNRYKLLNELAKYTTKEQLDWYMRFDWDNQLLKNLIEKKKLSIKQIKCS